MSLVVVTNGTGNLSNLASVSSGTTDPSSGNNSASQATSVQFEKGDQDNDLQTDLYLSNTVTPSNHLWLMNGVTQVSDLAFNPATGTANQRIVGVDDFDGDFRNDLVFHDSVSGAVEFWLMNGTDRIGSPVPLTGATPLALNWQLAATADFNADGSPDIVWRNGVSQKLVIWKMGEGAAPGTQKTGNLIPTPDQAVNANWAVVGALDLNADGFTDFLWYNSTSGKIVYWWMDASVVRIVGNFTVPDAAGNNNWKVFASGDYGVGPGGVADTKDIVWRNATSGKLVVWYMDTAGNRTAGTFTSPDAPPVPATDWTVVGPR